MCSKFGIFVPKSGFFHDFPLQIENNSAGPSLKGKVTLGTHEFHDSEFKMISDACVRRAQTYWNPHDFWAVQLFAK